MKNEIDRAQIFKTEDIGFAAALISNVQFTGIDINCEKVLYCFYFVPNIYSNINEYLKDYKAGSFNVDAQEYFYCLESLQNKDYKKFLEKEEDESN